MRLGIAWFLLATVVIPAPILTGWDTVADEATTAGLRGQGWYLISTKERREKQPGIPPYENLVRDIQITTFELAKGERRMICEMAYDSQLDKITESCWPVGAAK